MKTSVKSNNLLIFGIILIAIVGLRIISNTPVLIDGESYYNLRIAEQIREQIIVTEDPYSNSDYDFSLLNYLLALIPKEIAQFLPLILGYLSALLFYFITKKTIAITATAVLFASPLFLYHFSILTTVSLAIFLFLLSYKSYLDNHILRFTIINGLLALTNFPIWFVANILFLQKKTPIFALIPGILLSIFTFNIPIKTVGLFNELGSIAGYGLIILLLAVTGIIMKWNNKQILSIIIIGTMFITSIYLPDIRLFVLLLILPYVAEVIQIIANRAWQVPQLKNITIYLVVLIIVFSAVSQAVSIINSSPKRELGALNSLKNFEEGIVLSEEDIAFYVQYFSDKKTLSDIYSSNDLREKTTRFYQSQDVSLINNYIINNNIKYIIVKTDVDRSGFLFVADNAPGFEKLYEDKYYEVWTLTTLN